MPITVVKEDPSAYVIEGGPEGWDLYGPFPDAFSAYRWAMTPGGCGCPFTIREVWESVAPPF